jgi:hypothetical protein
MATVEAKLDALERVADDRELTPVEWWIGRDHQDEVLETAEDVETDGGLLVELRGRDVKLLTESPERFALWCEEGALDL